MKLLDRIFPVSDVEFARAIAGKIALQYPPKNEPKLQMQGGRKRLTGIVESVMAEISEYQRQHQMGWVRKARFGNEFRWQLKEIGYSEAFIDALTDGVVAHLATCLRNQGK
jgi:hypothetical protein